MNLRILCCAAALVLLGCTKVVDTIKASNTAAASSPKNAFTKFTIRQGRHYCEGNRLQAVETSELRFVVRFDSSAVYQTKSKENQYDINKLYGFSDNGAQHHQFSARFGWRWSEGALRLFAYVYNSTKMTFKELGTVALGAEVACSIKAAGNRYLFTVNGTTEHMPRQSTTPLAKGYLLYPYFGGDETAPHDISIWVRQL